MARQYINLTFTINVSTTAEDYLPADLDVTETITLQFPSVDPKYTVPPAKLVEGVTERVITEHRAKVRDYRDQQVATLEKQVETLEQRTRHLETERNEAVARANREQANADFYFKLYLDATREQANARKNFR